MLKKLDFYLVLFFFFLFLAVFYFRYPFLFNYRFDEGVVEDYLRSQDIEDKEDRIKNRIFISDDKIYLASGVLYARGADPADFNFQHPPLLKYLFGYSVLLFGTPYPVQIVFSLAFIFLVYFLGVLVFKSRLVSVIALSFLFFDPVFWENACFTLLDMGQVVFALSFLILFFYFPKKTFFQGVFLGLLFASKFWTLSLLFVLFLFAYKFIFLEQRINLKELSLMVLVSFLVFSIPYFMIFWEGGGLVDIILIQLKAFKFMLSHNSTVYFGNLFLLFVSGRYFSWWEKGWVVSNLWSFVWPLAFIVNLILLFKLRRQKNIWFVFLIPVFYFLVNLTNTAFTRYLLFVLPFLYLSASYFVVNLVKRGEPVIKSLNS